MRVCVKTIDGIDNRLRRAWVDLQRSNPAYSSPFFCFEFAAAVASVRNDVRVGIIEEDDEIVALFPFQIAARSSARPVGAGFSEFHAPLLKSGVSWKAAQLLRDCGLRNWSYDHLPLALDQFQDYHVRIGPSPYMDLSGGFDAYCRTKKDSGSQLINRWSRNQRKLEQEFGPLRLEMHDSSNKALSHLIAWKSAQHRRTGVVDVFEQPWVVQLLERLGDTQTAGFRGMLSLLTAGERPIAVHLGLRTDTVAHFWYPAYDVGYAKYSPGMVMALLLARDLAECGVKRLDFGPGGQAYKQRLATGSIAVALGVADRSRTRNSVRRSVSVAREWIRSTPLATPLRIPIRALRRLRNSFTQLRHRSSHWKPQHDTHS